MLAKRCTAKLHSPLDTGSQSAAKAGLERVQSSCFSFLDSRFTGVSLYPWLTHCFFCTSGIYILLNPRYSGQGPLLVPGFSELGKRAASWVLSGASAAPISCSFLAADSLLPPKLVSLSYGARGEGGKRGGNVSPLKSQPPCHWLGSPQPGCGLATVEGLKCGRALRTPQTDSGHPKTRPSSPWPGSSGHPASCPCSWPGSFRRAGDKRSPR